MSDDFASAGTDYGSAHFLSMSQTADGLHIKKTSDSPVAIY